MPRNVKIFLALSYLSILAGAVVAYIDHPRYAAFYAQVHQPDHSMITQIVTLLVMVGLISAAGLGRQNWARWVLLVFFVLGALLTIPSLMLVSKMGVALPVHPVFIAFQTLIQAIALYLVFTGDAKPWFSKETVAA